MCSILWLLRTTFELAFWIKYINLSNFMDDPLFNVYMEIVEVALSILPMFIILMILFALSTKKTNGLWSTEQPFVPSGAYGNQGAYGNNWVQPTSPVSQHQPVYYPPQQNHPGYYPPQQQQFQQQHNYQQQPQGYPPTVQSRSPPPHDEAMGFNHQADGTPPQAMAETYVPKH